MEGILVACGQITWPRGTPEEQMLAEIAQAGYEGAPAGLWSGRSPEETVALYARYGLKPAPGYLGAEFWKKDKQEEIIARATEMARFARAVGCGELYVAANGFDYVTRRGLTRSQTASHVRPEDALTDAEMRQFAETLTRVGEATLRERVRSCFHNHVGTPIETRAEIDRLFALVDRAVVFQGPDIGHLAWAGVDPVAFCRDFAASIKTLHLKDINPTVRAEGSRAEWDYATFSAHGIFVELGEGMVDFPALFQVLSEAGFQGWIVVETDVTQKASALESARCSRDYLRSLGI